MQQQRCTLHSGKFCCRAFRTSFLSERRCHVSQFTCTYERNLLSLQIPEKREASERERPFCDTASREWPSQPSERQKLTLSTSICTITDIFFNWPRRTRPAVEHLERAPHSWARPVHNKQGSAPGHGCKHINKTRLKMCKWQIF